MMMVMMLVMVVMMCDDVLVYGMGGWKDCELICDLLKNGCVE